MGIVRRRLSSEALVALESGSTPQQTLSFIDGPDDLQLYEYSVLVTNLASDVVTVVHHYRDRADCENNFDEIKNQWGWGGFTTHDIKSCRLMARMIALIYNWWTLFARLANPDTHLEAITSRPLLLSSVGRLVRSGRQKTLIVTHRHGKEKRVRLCYHRLVEFFKQLKLIAPQLSPTACWQRILAQIIATFKAKNSRPYNMLLPAPS